MNWSGGCEDDKKVRMKNRFLDAAARQAAEIQRKAFLHMLGLQMGNVLQPLDPDRGPIAKEEVARVFERINEATDELCTAHADSLPADCTRAPVHLQMVSLALASQEVLLEDHRLRGVHLKRGSRSLRP